jgi:hypothetical protein
MATVLVLHCGDWMRLLTGEASVTVRGPTTGVAVDEVIFVGRVSIWLLGLARTQAKSLVLSQFGDGARFPFPIPPRLIHLLGDSDGSDLIPVGLLSEPNQ